MHHVSLVVGFETARAWETLWAVQQTPGFGPIAFSIDLKNGQLLGDWRGWGLDGPDDVLGLARQVVQRGIRTLIVLDLARVGTGTGCGTEQLLCNLRNEHTDIDLIAGGGVRSWEDVDRLGTAGANAVLVASALHNRAFDLGVTGMARRNCLGL
jgi:phosphoribosylformimino-5-aminoimidazole carboxamide ribotide isomerase